MLRQFIEFTACIALYVAMLLFGSGAICRAEHVAAPEAAATVSAAFSK